jgi:predicted ATPase/Tfp pilus assembly protein PilF
MFHPQDVIGPYTMVRLLGRGAFGEVWLAEERSELLTAQVALKFPFASGDDLEKIRHEARLWNQATGHPNIVPVLGAHIFDGQVVIISEYISGGTLAAWLQKSGGSAPTVQTAVSMASGILLGLEHLHTTGIIHRDLKPENVLLQGGIPRLTDFGLARVLRTAGHTSSITGTPSYMAPEAFTGDYSRASDLWAIGAMLYEMLSGQLPFPQRDIVQLMQAIQRDRPPPLPTAVSEPLHIVVESLLAKSPSQRYQSALSVLDLLRADRSSLVQSIPSTRGRGALNERMTLLSAGAATQPRSAGRESEPVPPHFSTILSECAEAHGGFVDTSRNALTAVFREASDGIQAALDLRRRVQAGQTHPEAPPPVRMGLHVGEVRALGSRVDGPAVGRCIHIQSVANPGQVVLSQSLYEEIAGQPIGGVILTDLGHHRLKDLRAPERLWQADVLNARFEFPPLPSLTNLPNNLPVQLTPIIGREEQIEAIRSRLATRSLVTLIGESGSGKTRLALHAAAQAIDTFADGVWLVDLSALSDASVVPQAIATVLGLREEAGRSHERTLTDYLKGKSILLLLDNCEYLATACRDLVKSLLRTCESLKILATSQKALGVPGEARFPLHGLLHPATPGPEDEFDAGAAEGTEAVRLFLECAVLANPQFAPTPASLPAIAQIARRVEGNPLCIELAAAQVRMRTPQQIVQADFWQWDDDTAGAEHHHGPEAMVRYSSGLLTDAERALVRRLSVFRGGWFLGAAEAICSGDGIPEKSVFGLLRGLYDSSLLVAEPYGDREAVMRYRLREIVREFYRMRLAEVGEAEALDSRHFDYFVELAKREEPRLKTADQFEALEAFDAEQDNFRAALEHASTDQERLRLAGSLWRYWLMRSYFTEGRKWLTISGQSEIEPEIRATSLNARGVLASRQGDYVAASECLGLALELRRTLADPADIAESLLNWGNLSRVLGDRALARTSLNESLQLYQAVGNRWGVASVQTNIGILDAEEGDHSAARAQHDQSLRTFSELGDRVSATSVTINIGVVAFEQRDHVAAKQYFEEALAALRITKNPAVEAIVLHNAGQASYELGDYAAADDRMKRSLRLRNRLGDRSGCIYPLNGLGMVAYSRGDYERAALFFGAAAQLRETFGIVPTAEDQHKFDERERDVRSKLGGQRFEECWRRVRAMDWDSLVASATGRPNI